MIPSTVLVAAHAFGGELDAMRAAQAIGRGLQAGNPELETDLCPIDALPADLDARMRRARAVVAAAERLHHETLLRGDAVFEIATRARQAGVPCYAIAGRDELDLFEKRILDLQVVMEAQVVVEAQAVMEAQVVMEAAAERALAAVAKKLAASIL